MEQASYTEDHHQPTLGKKTTPLELNLRFKMSFTANSIPARIRYSGPHNTETLHTEDEGNIIYLRGYKLRCAASTEQNKTGNQQSEEQNKEEQTKDRQSLNLQGQGVIITKQFDSLLNVGAVSDFKWFEREGDQTDIAQKIREFYEVADLIHD